MNLTVSSWPRDPTSIEELINKIIDYGYQESSEFPLSTDISRDPWSWANNPSVLYLTFDHRNSFAGILVARLLPNNIHIHALWIPPPKRSIGIGSSIILSLTSYFKFMPLNTTITLHAYSSNIAAIRFYQKSGFTLLNTDLIPDTQGLNQWIKHASQFQWPLSAGKVLYWKYLNQ